METRKKNAPFKGACKVQFFASKDFIIEKINQRYPLKEIWKMLQSENKYSCTYEGFIKQCSIEFKEPKIEEIKITSKEKDTKEPIWATTVPKREPRFKPRGKIDKSKLY